MIALTEYPEHEKLSQALSRPVPAGEVHAWWLGQAGFAFKCADTFLLLDPYLSDFLAKKYKGKEFTHLRMMDSPLAPEEIENVKYVLCTHKHSDHMDPETVLPVAHNNPDCVFVIPRAELNWSKELGLREVQLHGMNAGETFSPVEGLTIAAIPAAHEEIKINGQGEHHFLGYIVNLGDVTFYHSGDCLPYAGLEAKLSTHAIDVALLPVNGRDEFRASRNVPGNFTLDEAVELCRHLDIPFILGHHFGMFDFNTVDPTEVEPHFQDIRGTLQGGLVKAWTHYVFSTL